MHKHVSKSQFKAQALEWFRQVETTGKAVIVTDHGKPAVEVRKYQDKQRAPLEILNGSVAEYTDATDPVVTEDWEALQ